MNMESKKAKRCDSLDIVDWNDKVLVQAFQETMNPLNRVVNTNISSKQQNNEAVNKWKIGDYCRAVYCGDNLTYEGKILNISDNYCTVMFLGYDEEVEIDVNTLTESHGKRARKKQIEKAKKHAVYSSEDDNASEEEISAHANIQDETYRFSHYSDASTRSKQNNPSNQVIDCSMHDHTAMNSAFHTHHAPLLDNGVCASNSVPPAPPMPINSDIAQNPTVTAMLTSWYMAGYYTGLHEAQKKLSCQKRCCPVNRTCHHI